MSKVSFRLTYDGPALSEHGMDVGDLAPSLLALGELIKQANFRLNGDASKVNLIVQSDFEHGCFQVRLELIQSAMGALMTIFGQDGLKTAKNIAEWVGLIHDVAKKGVSLFKLLSAKEGKEVEEVTRLESLDEKGLVSIKFRGDSNVIIVNKFVYQLSEDPAIKRHAAKFVSPLQSEGIESLSFEADLPGDRISKKEANSIIKEVQIELEATIEEFEPQPVIAHLQISRPDFSPGSKVWKFWYGDRNIQVDISNTGIKEQVLNRKFIRIDDTWKVRMSITEKRTAGGRFKNEYKIIEVLEFIPALSQGKLFELPDEAD